MRKYLRDYIMRIEQILNSNDKKDVDKLIKEHLIQIQFMQHERLIHLIVTCLFAVLLFITIAVFIISEYVYLIGLIVLLLVLVIPYIRHYYFLENNVQKLYAIYNQLQEIQKISDMP